MKKSKVELSPQDLGTLCICALRYCQGRKTYMPSMVREIVRSVMPKLRDLDIGVMLDDCDFQEKTGLYGDEQVDKPGWILWKEELAREWNRRKNK